MHLKLALLQQQQPLVTVARMRYMEDIERDGFLEVLSKAVNFARASQNVSQVLVNLEEVFKSVKSDCDHVPSYDETKRGEEKRKSEDIEEIKKTVTKILESLKVNPDDVLHVEIDCVVNYIYKMTISAK